MTNEQQRIFPSAKKDEQDSQSMYNELSRMNSELVTTQRELAKKASELEKLAKENERLYQEAQEALRLRNQFLSIISHDLKTPLASIKGYAQVLSRLIRRMDLPDAAKLLDGLTMIDASATKMSGQINELLDVARLQMGHSIELNRQPVDLVDLARQVIDELPPSTQRRPPVRIATSTPELIGFWDSSRIERVLINLLSNAIKYSPDGGDIVVEIECEDSASGAWAVLKVRDHGLGIPEEDLPYIFDPFHRSSSTAERISGTGLGLASTRKIVEQHAGRISVESQVGKGTTFTVRLPLVPPDDADPS